MISWRYRKLFATPRVSSRIPPRTSSETSVPGTYMQDYALTRDRRRRSVPMGLLDLLAGLYSRAGDDHLPPALMLYRLTSVRCDDIVRSSAQ